jgi:hypothetical protein
MISINVIDGRISGSYGDKTFSVDFNKEIYNQMLSLQAQAESAASIEEYQTILKAFEPFTVQDYTKTIQDKCEFIHVNKSTGEFFLQHNGVVSSIPMPAALVARIYESMDKGLDFMPLVKMWTRWLRNPVLRTKMKKGWGREFCERFFNYINLEYVHPKLKEELMEEHGLSEEVAERRATMYQMKITKEGLLNGYKVSEEVLTKYEEGEDGEAIEVPRYKRTFNVDTGEIESDGLPEHVEDRLFIPAVMGKGGDAFFCEGTNGYAKPCHFIKVGCTHRLPDWSYVNTNDRRSCVPGLHFGGLEYINMIGGEIHNIFVDPMHIGAVPDDETGAARCLQYFVHSSLAGVNGSIYHSSTYAAKTDAEWEEMRQKIVEEYDNSTTERGKEVGELTNL